jgi:hypothetical protein
MPWILLFNGVPSRWMSLRAPHIGTDCTGAILGGRIFALSVEACLENRELTNMRPAASRPFVIVVIVLGHN